MFYTSCCFRVRKDQKLRLCVSASKMSSVPLRRSLLLPSRSKSGGISLGFWPGSPSGPAPNERFLALFSLNARPDVEPRVLEGAPEADDVGAPVLVAGGRASSRDGRVARDCYMAPLPCETRTG